MIQNFFKETQKMGFKSESRCAKLRATVRNCAELRECTGRVQVKFIHLKPYSKVRKTETRYLKFLSVCQINVIFRKVQNMS